MTWLDEALYTFVMVGSGMVLGGAIAVLLAHFGVLDYTH